MILNLNSRLKYKIEETLLSDKSSMLVFRSYNIAQLLSDQINKLNKNAGGSLSINDTARSSEIYVMGLFSELFNEMFDFFTKLNKKSNTKENLIDHLISQSGEKKLLMSLKLFAETFPSNEIYNKVKTFEQYQNQSKNVKVKYNFQLLKEVVYLRFLNDNNALKKPVYEELLSYEDLKNNSSILEIYESIDSFFKKNQLDSFNELDLINFLSYPSVKFPNSLENQLEFIIKFWGKYLTQNLLKKLKKSLGLVIEENKSIWNMMHKEKSYSPILVYNGEEELFSIDQDWMPNVVMIAKSIYVWLDQLSKKYKANIDKLDLIPDEELDILVDRGFTALWLIGIWERSEASKKIKNIMGNPEAKASAYSIRDYTIANELGGYDSYESLRHRIEARGLRLASDMVPNHMAIDSDLVLNNPEYFISTDNPPFPNYSFNGSNLSDNPDIGIYIEDHYYDRSDAAVVFKRVDNNSKETKYIYHGNDGTSIPWNDTAQLDYLNPIVREHLINTIIHVAKMFPIIRFDAAMTLAKKEYQRLWYPKVGKGADIPSRSNFALPDSEFNKKFQKEFWREVVDRMTIESPNTLLLAEAFWMLEGYFVRTLGMHRVYNSAFMNMLKNEQNRDYRQTIKNTLEFDPEILQRFVNFMNNPDEETSIVQFGDNDKYFGVLVMMCTMPGLPMFGHGQIEGFHEKYGMEYSRAYWKENENIDLIRRHEIEIFPLLRKRHLFSLAKFFRLFNFYNSNNQLNENVFAYTNKYGFENSLIIYNNKYENTTGWIKESSPFLDKWAPKRIIRKESISESLQLTTDDNYYVIFSDLKNNLSYIRKSVDIISNGLYIELDAYQHYVFSEIYEVKDNEGVYKSIHDQLNGKGVENIQDAVINFKFSELHKLFEKLLNKMNYDTIFNQSSKLLDKDKNKFKNVLANYYRNFIDHIIKDLDLTDNNAKDLVNEFLEYLFIVFNKELYPEGIKTLLNSIEFPDSISSFIFNKDYYLLSSYFVTSTILFLGKIKFESSWKQQSIEFLNEYNLNKIIYEFFNSIELTIENNEGIINSIKFLMYYNKWNDDTYLSNIPLYFLDIINDDLIKNFIGVNYFNEITWFNKEKFEKFIMLLTFESILSSISIKNYKLTFNSLNISNTLKFIKKIIDLSIKSNYNLNKLIELIKDEYLELS